jgi:hypothetical protein
MYDPARGEFMDKVIRESASALPPTRLSFGAGKGTFHAQLWSGVGGLAAVLIVALATACVSAIGHGASRPVKKDGEVFAGSEASLPDFPPESRNEANYNMIARMGWVPDLDGTVVAYVEEANRLVEGGRFRTDLSLGQMARALRINPSSIANPRSPTKIDPDAELFWESRTDCPTCSACRSGRPARAR